MCTRGSPREGTVGGTPPEPDGTGGGAGEDLSDLLEQKQADKDERAEASFSPPQTAFWYATGDSVRVLGQLGGGHRMPPKLVNVIAKQNKPRGCPELALRSSRWPPLSHPACFPPRRLVPQP